MKEIVFSKAHIVAVEHKIANGNVTSRIKCTAEFNTKIATAMEMRWVLFDKEQIVKSGFQTIELDYAIKSVRMKFSVPKLACPELDLTSEMANHFKVMRQGDGKKKPKKLMVSFRVEHSGSPFDLLTYLIQIGGTEGELSLTPLQAEMFDSAPAERKRAEVKPKVATAVN